MNKAEQLLEKVEEKRVNLLRDDSGVYAEELTNVVLFARAYVLKEKWVSCHFNIVNTAAEKKKELWMYVDNEDRFYSISPGKAFEKGTVNNRGKSAVLNFELLRCLK